MNKVLIAITTGRQIFKSTINQLAHNFDHFGHFETYQIGLLINYDPSFLNLSAQCFKYEVPQSKLFSEIIYVGPENIGSFETDMIRFGLTKESANLLCLRKGFGNKKNIILYQAIRRNYDKIILWDDDEYPVICVKKNDIVSWQFTDVLAAHLGNKVDQFDVATGFWSGHVFPTIPNIQDKLGQENAIRLGEALGMGTETHSKDSFVSSEKCFEFNQGIPQQKIIEVENGGKWISGGNVSLTVAKIIDGTIPPFYTPTDSRGEDTIMSMNLTTAHVCLVPSGAFHDMYLDYPEIPEGHYPKTVGFIADHYHKYLKRFSLALKAWLAYAPLFVRLKNADNFSEITDEMIAKLSIVDKSLQSKFPELVLEMKGETLSGLLKHYVDHAHIEYENLQNCYDAWRYLCTKLST